MKKFLLIPIVVIFFTPGCKKENPVTATPVARVNIAPQAFAGEDFNIFLPADSATLNGKFNVAPSDIVHHTWKKIFGPSSYVIEKPQSLHTKVYNLEKGVYGFEFTVTDKGGLTGKDTVTVYIYHQHIAGSNEFVIKNLKWIYPWYSAIEVKNINAFISANSALKKAYVQRGFDSTWIEVNYISSDPNNNLYEYFIETRPDGAGMYTTGSLYIFYYGNNTTDSPQVKIQF